MLATVLALVAITVYIWFRFEWQFGVGAMISTLHDVITTVGLFALFQLEFNLTTLAAILTIAGYSVNDTVVIYDRIRESLRKYQTMPFRELINLSLNETLSRTILTVSTVALAVLSLLFFGGEVLRGFSIAMLWGIVIGTYSSLFIAAPILYYVRPNRRCDRRSSEAAQAGAARCAGAVTPASQHGPDTADPGRTPGHRALRAERVSGDRRHSPRADHRLPRQHDPVASRRCGRGHLGEPFSGGRAWRRADPAARARPLGEAGRRITTASVACGRNSLEPMSTGAACRTYNVLVGEGRQVAAALIPLPDPPLQATRLGISADWVVGSATFSLIRNNLPLE